MTTNELARRARAIAAWGIIACAVLSAPADDLLVSAYTSNSIGAHCGTDGRFLENLPGRGGVLQGPQSITLGPDGLLYVCSENANRILRYEMWTWDLIDSFVWDDPATGVDETGGLAGPTAAVFGPDGHLYVASFDTDAILRYDGNTGEFLDIFVRSGRGGLNGPDAGMTFNADGDLLVPSYYTNAILKYSGVDGSSMGALVTAGAGGLTNPRVILLREDIGDMLVSSWGTNSVLRYDAASGASLGAFATGIAQPSGLERDADGNIYVIRMTNGAVRRYNADGTFLGIFARSADGGAQDATFLRFVPTRRCQGDVDQDGDVDLADLGQLLAAYGVCAPDPRYLPNADTDGSRCVDLTDLGRLLANFGP